MIKIGELKAKAKHFILLYNDKTRNNPYRLYEKFWDNGWHQKLIVTYQDLYSVTLTVNEYISKHNEDGR